jgi:hypothetical protein
MLGVYTLSFAVNFGALVRLAWWRTELHERDGSRRRRLDIKKALIAMAVGFSPRRHGRACPGYPRRQRFKDGSDMGRPEAKFCRHEAFAVAALTNIRSAEPRG